MNRAFLLGASIALALPGAVLAQNNPAGGYVTRPVRFATPPVIDGKLDEPVWQTAAKLDGFRQLEPDEGGPASEATEVYLGYDENNLYVGARCHDSEPGKMVATVLTRDADLNYDDSLQIILDTFHDRRGGFLFATSPVGVQVDALVRSEGEEVNFSWDGIWTVRTTRDAGGWTMEMAIPWQTLRFPGRPEQDWGFNVERYVARKQEKSYWKPMRREYGFYARYKISQFGELVGLEGARQGRRFQLAPYLVAGAEQPPGGSTSRVTHAGGDLKFNVSTDLVADLTVKTDFSETEADEQDVNLSRNSLLFPEKRVFFLEGASLFYFGDRPEPHHVADQNFLFFSRKIGLTPDGRAVIPLLGGVKLTGYQGDTSVGALSLQTEATRKPDGYGGLIDEPRTTWSVVRVKQAIGEGSSFGILGLSKDASGDHNRVGGMDWDLALNPNLRAAGYVAKSTTPGIQSDEWAGSSDVFWDSRSWRFHYAFSQFGEGFNDELGYLLRTGVRHWRADQDYVLWPETGPFKQTWFTYDMDYYTDRATGQIQTRVNNLQANAFFRNSAGISFKFYNNLEVLTSPFEIKHGYVIPPGSYHFSNYFFGFQTDYTRAFGATGRLAWGDYYDGSYLQAFYYLSYRPVPGLLTELTFQQTQVRLKEGTFNSDIFLGTTSYSFSPRLATRVWVQWARGANLREKLDVNWEFRPGSKLFIVYENIKSYVDFFDPRQPLFGTPGRSLLAKIVVLF
jgi:hypothetical protein